MLDSSADFKCKDWRLSNLARSAFRADIETKAAGLGNPGGVAKCYDKLSKINVSLQCDNDCNHFGICRLSSQSAMRLFSYWGTDDAITQQQGVKTRLANIHNWADAISVLFAMCQSPASSHERPQGCVRLSPSE